MNPIRHTKDPDVQRFFNDRLKACVLDSCPGELSLRLLIDAIASSLKPNNFLTRHAATLVKTFMVTCWALLLLFLYKRNRHILSAQTFRNWFSRPRGGRPPLASLFGIVSLAVVFFLPLISKLGERRNTWKYWSGLTSMVGIKAPWLFVYGDADRLVLPQHVQQVMERRRANGGQVDSHCFEGSSHVQHLRAHPEKYKSVVLNFVKKHLLAD